MKQKRWLFSGQTKTAVRFCGSSSVVVVNAVQSSRTATHPPLCSSLGLHVSPLMFETPSARSGGGLPCSGTHCPVPCSLCVSLLLDIGLAVRGDAVRCENGMLVPLTTIATCLLWPLVSTCSLGLESFPLDNYVQIHHQRQSHPRTLRGSVLH